MRVLIVDGHSVIFSWPELRKLHSRRMVLARDSLIHSLTQYQDASGIHVVAVFDGQGEKFSEQSEPGGIQIFYSATGQTADQIVERLVAKYGGSHDITVATSDRLEQVTASAFGATIVSPEGLRAVLHEALTDLARRLKARRR